MTASLAAREIAAALNAKFPGAAEEVGANGALVKNESLFAVMEYLKTGEGLKFDYFNYVTAVDYYSYFEMVYQLTSLESNRSVMIKARCYDRENPTLPSVTALWQGADFQEREIFDLFGIKFEGHPNLKRIFLWDGFPGHPLRKDFNG
ncbi:MAG: NADH-quinone oxidoreductase subunit C [Dehalococcoidales bacterium]